MTNEFFNYIILNENGEPALNENGLPQLKARPATKAVQDIERLIALNKPVGVISKFAELVSLGEQWDWAQSYHAYLIECQSVDEYNSNLPPPIEDGEGEVVEVSKKEMPQEPLQPEVKTVDDVLAPYARTIYKMDRQQKLDSLTVEVDGMIFDGDEDSQNRMSRAAFSMSDDDLIGWVLNDNSSVQVSKAQLCQALKLAGTKQTELWINNNNE